MKGERMVFLYTELAGYFLACVDELGENELVDSLDVIHWPVNQEAPYAIEERKSYSLNSKSEFSRSELLRWVDEISPTVLFVSGWTDDDYLHIAKSYVHRIPVVLAMDNWWTGTPKQRIACLLSNWSIKRYFNAAWVPGAPQLEFARRLGFESERIKSGFYCADPKTFDTIYNLRKKRLQKDSKTILFIGRYVVIKGIIELWKCFIELSNEFPEWELHCIGTGPLWDERPVHPKIKHHGFVQPHELKTVAADADLFVMPSHKEPWGVVLHEMALCGMATLVSDAVGSSSAFVKHGESGHVFQMKQLKAALRQCLSKNRETLEQEGSYGRKLALTLTPSEWSRFALDFSQLTPNHH